MYAIVKTGGKQYRVEPGQRLLVERLAAAEGETVALQPLMYRSEEIVCDAGALGDVKVAAKVIEHPRGEKLRVFKFKPKRGYKRRTGHRQELTMIEVTDISFGKGAKAAPASKPKPAASEKAAAKPKAPAKPKASADSEPAVADTAQEAENGS
ncbi:MAG TPA: 50S ribosomal protein L21 [Solirubrobacteraceae bacterium]|jgi:large subunit ribosomal protein L21|nr:50S ribosomal protein L21 [Solirubrobacteraceae bacterium]